ncbi:single-stranded DNA-binding protein [Candidatus Nephthysia bennettiae]|uniref:Single-stranded DNA-binding protein n=1 Tax=Candidatus Nephthysia bennettiae TaxID=3127016 RepID=A0A934K192_9BACT|nr:single-stranded DNA-binding protein [Candidatus Dormibacteraeota bacterium]MBJ7613486.1 single-stranded DNA-binding protein [Candidatus Dormibacteraeota bacterium]
MTANGDVNRWELTGRMAHDAEVQESNGRKRLRLRVAVHESGPEGATHFFTVVYFGAGEEQAAGLPKGRQVRLSGRVTAWKDQEGKERLGLVATDLAAIA